MLPYMQIALMKRSPILTPTLPQARLVASDGEAGETFGRSSAVSDDGNTFVIGSEFDDDGGTSSGSLYVYIRDTVTKAITQQAKLFLPIPLLRLGCSVAISADGNTIIAGNALSAGNVLHGWKRSGGVWTALTIAAPSVTGGGYGRAVSLSSDGTKLVVGAPFQTNGAAAQGGASFVFTRSGDNFTQQARLLHSSPVADDVVGGDVSMSGNGLYIYAGRSYIGGGTLFLGIVFFFNGSAWAQQQVIGNTITPYFTCGVFDETGTYLFVLDRAFTNAGRTGRMIAYKRGGTVWVSVATPIAPGTDLYGSVDQQIACSADARFLVAPTKLTGQQGKVALWKKAAADSWNFLGFITPTLMSITDVVANLALSGDGKTMVAGAHLVTVGSNATQGAAYVFTTSDNAA